MRILRIALLIMFVITAVVFGIDQYCSYKDRDVIAPVISVDKDVLNLSVDATDEDLLKGVSALDEHDGDVTTSLIIAGKSNFIEEGIIRVDYAAFDSHNNIGTYSRRVIYVDYHSPRFFSDVPLILRSESSYDFSFLHAVDVLSGDISNKIKILSDSTAISNSSELPIEIEVTNSYGDVEKLDLVMDVLTNSEYNRIYPALSEYILYIPKGEKEDFSSYIIGIRQGDKLLQFEDTGFSIGDIEIEDYVDYSKPGIYTVTFSLWQSEKLTTKTKMTVIVTEDF